MDDEGLGRAMRLAAIAAVTAVITAAIVVVAGWPLVRGAFGG